MRVIAIHQPNFCPWLAYFYKMAMADLFIVLTNVQFEKNGYQNRYKLSNGTWVTKSIQRGMESIAYKKYSDGSALLDINMDWINCIKKTLGIRTPIVIDHPLDLSGTDRLIELIKCHKGTHYLTNPEAKEKYLDEDKMRSAGIQIVYCNVPKQLKIHVFEAFEKWGIDGTANQMPGKVCRV